MSSEEYGAIYHTVLEQIMAACEPPRSFNGWHTGVNAVRTALAATRLRDTLTAWKRNAQSWKDTADLNRAYSALVAEAREKLTEQFTPALAYLRKAGLPEKGLDEAERLGNEILRLLGSPLYSHTPDCISFLCAPDAETWLFNSAKNDEIKIIG